MAWHIHLWLTLQEDGGQIEVLERPVARSLRPFGGHSYYVHLSR